MARSQRALTTATSVWLADESNVKLARVPVVRAAEPPTLAAWAWPQRGAASADKAVLLAREHVLDLVSEALRTAGLSALLVKGAGLAHLYPSPWLRPMSDIDLLLRERDLGPVVDALGVAGFAVEHDSARSRTARLLEVAARPPPTAMQLLLELHISMDKVVLRPIDVDAIFDRAAPVASRPSLRIPSLEDHVLLVVLHLAADEFRHATGMVDLEVLVKAGADLDVVVARSRAAGASTASYVAFAALHHLVPGLVPSSILRSMRPSSAHEALLRTRFELGQWPVAKHAGKLGAPWIIGQWLLRDDVTEFGFGLARYASERLVERSTTLLLKLRQ